MTFLPVSILYIHVPFRSNLGVRIDAYAEPYEAARVDRYLECLHRELLMSRLFGPFAAIYIGGGDPACMSIDQVHQLCVPFQEKFDSVGPAEWSIQASVATVTRAAIEMYATAGLTRVCFFCGAEGVARLQTVAAWTKESRLEAAVDLYIDPGKDDLDAWEQAVKMIQASGFAHISTYTCADSSGDALTEVSFLGAIDRFMERHGFDRYELWSYARPGRVCRYTELCWRGAPLLALGPAATSSIGTRRWKNTENLGAYLEALEQGRPPPREVETFSPKTWMTERVLLGLHAKDGVGEEDVMNSLRDRFPTPGSMAPEISKHWKKLLALFQSLEEEGLLVGQETRWTLTDEGRYKADAVMRRLVV